MLVKTTNNQQPDVKIIQPFLSSGILRTTMNPSFVLFAKQMGIAAVVHLYVFPAKPYMRGERCVRNVAVMDDYAAIGTPPDPEEVRESERFSKMNLARYDEREKRLTIRQSVRDVVLGSGEIVVDDVKYTVSHVVEPVERGIAKINKTFHQISENVKQHEKRRRDSKDDSFVIPLPSWSGEFTEALDHALEGSVSDSGLSATGKKHVYHPFKSSASGGKFRGKS
ncbi:hypothetical protein GIB67_018363 [Kingdonia uniflora]|uniref:Uncharacterized protein n=1 Tax=Kingdonia uniflora TaxID=39325 RepID=A0A7J7MJ62_9MAGN|nr:hypothetical protein GIB67_018363 [Kingdonia uniflora]